MPSDESAEPITSDNPIRGALIKKQYTAIAHFILISELLPSDADLHLISDPEGAFVVAEPVGFAGPLKEQRADLTFVTFDKKASNPTKKALVAKYKRKLQQFIDQHGQGQDASANRLHRPRDRNLEVCVVLAEERSIVLDDWRSAEILRAEGTGPYCPRVVRRKPMHAVGDPGLPPIADALQVCIDLLGGARI
jgi:hypothetical protein